MKRTSPADWLDSFVLEKRVDERSGAGAAEDDEKCKEQKYNDDGSEPPFLIVLDEVHQLSHQAGRSFLGLVGETLFGFLIGSRSIAGSRIAHDDQN